MKIAICGDIYMGGVLNGRFLDASVEECLASADLRVGNLEAPVTVSAHRAPKSGPTLRQNDAVPKLLRESGFDIVCLANNHLGDFGEDGIRDTLNALNARELKYFGASTAQGGAYRPLKVERQGKTIAFLGFCESQFGQARSDSESGVAWINHPDTERIVSKTADEADMTIVMAHCGLEDARLPLPEWRARYRKLCDAGADAIVGSHPHVVQPLEIYGDKAIYYSLGDFFFKWEGKPAPEANVGLIAEIELNETGFSFGYKWVGTASGQVSFDRDETRRSAGLTRIDETSYMEEIDKICSDFFQSRYLPLLAYSLGGATDGLSLWGRTKRAARIVLPSRDLALKRDKELLLLNLFRCESHRFTIQRALESRLMRGDGHGGT